MGGEVIEMGGVTRVNGTLAVARAIGIYIHFFVDRIWFNCYQ